MYNADGIAKKKQKQKKNQTCSIAELYLSCSLNKYFVKGVQMEKKTSLMGIININIKFYHSLAGVRDNVSTVQRALTKRGLDGSLKLSCDCMMLLTDMSLSAYETS